MKQNLIALFIATVMFVQVFPVASLMLLTKSLDKDYAVENEIALSISLEQIEEDNVDVAKVLTDHLNWYAIAIPHNTNEPKVHFIQNDNKPNKGHVSILIPPPNFQA